MLKKMIWNAEDKTIRGAFINFSLTIFYSIMIIVGCIFPSVASNLREMESLLIGFFAISFGCWAGKKSVEFVKKTSDVNSILSKHGLDMRDLPIVGEAVRAYQEKSETSRVTVTPDPEAQQRAMEKEAAK
jgi:hypothetical protein